MIIDTIEKLTDYVSLNPLFADVVEFLKNNDLRKLEPGKHSIKGDDVFVNTQAAKGKSPEEAVVETHRVMADIQIPLSGNESYGYIPANMLPDVEYNTQKDISFFPGVKSLNIVTCTPDMFYIFFPQDGHAPCISSDKEIKKAIFKVKC